MKHIIKITAIAVTAFTAFVGLNSFVVSDHASLQRAEIYSFPEQTTEGWHEAGNWELGTPSEACSAGDVPCQIDLTGTGTTDLQTFLNRFNEDNPEDLLADPAVQSKPLPQ